MSVNRCFIALGSNEGDRLALLTHAMEQLAASGRMTPPRYLYETRPVGPSNTPFLNTAIELRTESSPPDLLTELHRLEAQAGRQRRQHWGARTLDLDLLYVERDGQPVRHVDAPIVPHPRLHQRDFVLAPLCDLDPTLVVAGATVRQWLERIPVEQRTILGRLAHSPR